MKKYYKNHTINLISILSVGILCSCDTDDTIASCGTFNSLMSFSETELLEKTFMDNSKLILIKEGFQNSFSDFKIEDGDKVVFHFVRFEDPFRDDTIPVMDGKYEFHLLFQINYEDLKSVLISSSEFRKQNVFYRSYSYGINNGLIKEDIGCIYLEKLNDDEWRVSVNLTYLNVKGVRDGELVGENKEIFFTDIFKRGKVVYDDDSMSFGQR